MLTPSEHLNSPTSLRGGRVAQSLVFCVVKHWPFCLFVFILLAILIICSYMYICGSMSIYPLQRVFYPQNRPCTPKIVGTFYMQGYKVKEKQQLYPIVPPLSKLSGHPVVDSDYPLDLFKYFSYTSHYW